MHESPIHDAPPHEPCRAPSRSGSHPPCRRSSGLVPRLPRRSSSVLGRSQTWRSGPVGVRPPPADMDGAVGIVCQRDVNARAAHDHQRAPTKTYGAGSREPREQDQRQPARTGAYVDHFAHNPKVAGSNPAPATNSTSSEALSAPAGRASSVAGVNAMSTPRSRVRRHALVSARGSREVLSGVRRSSERPGVLGRVPTGPFSTGERLRLASPNERRWGANPMVRPVPFHASYLLLLGCWTRLVQLGPAGQRKPEVASAPGQRRRFQRWRGSRRPR